jgi:S1-C subfamily serine protease
LASGFTTRLLSLIFVVAGVVAAQSAPVRKDIPLIAKAANGSIVSIVMSDKDGKPLGQGSGFVVSKDGLIITNYHVIAEGVSAVAKLPDGAFYLVDGVVASDKVRDVAVLKAQGHNFRTLTLGNSDRVQVGEEVVAIGSPLSLESTVSNGIVSGMRTVKEEGGKFLQITAPISPGSSGGPLFNLSGEVIGITTMYLKGGENLNFAIPINDAKHLLLADSTKLKELPNEEVAYESGGNGDGTGTLCRYFVDRITISLPQAPTLCQDDSSTSRNKTVSIFSPTRVLGGPLRRAWSTALFQTLQTAAIDGPCQGGCLVSVCRAENRPV